MMIKELQKGKPMTDDNPYIHDPVPPPDPSTLYTKYLEYHRSLGIIPQHHVYPNETPRSMKTPLTLPSVHQNDRPL